MTAWSDNFDDSPGSPNREAKKLDQERSQALNEHVNRVIQEFQNHGAYILLRWLESSLGGNNDEAKDILQDGLIQWWKTYSHKLSPDATVKDVEPLLWKICQNLVYDRHRRNKRRGIQVPWNRPTQDNEEDATRKEIEREWIRQQEGNELEDVVCQVMHDRDVMKTVLKHFKKKEDQRCLYLMIQRMKPHEMVGDVPGSADSIRQRCKRIRKRLLEILREMGIISKEFDPDGG